MLVAIDYLNGSTSNIQVLTFPCTKPSLHVILHAYVHGMYVLYVFKLQCLLSYFNQEVILADVLLCFMHAELKRLITRLRCN